MLLQVRVGEKAAARSKALVAPALPMNFLEGLWRDKPQLAPHFSLGVFRSANSLDGETRRTSSTYSDSIEYRYIAVTLATLQKLAIKACPDGHG